MTSNYKKCELIKDSMKGSLIKDSMKGSFGPIVLNK
jgi:hypothetical protein